MKTITKGGICLLLAVSVLSALLTPTAFAAYKRSTEAVGESHYINPEELDSYIFVDGAESKDTSTPDAYVHTANGLTGYIWGWGFFGIKVKSCEVIEGDDKVTVETNEITNKTYNIVLDSSTLMDADFTLAVDAGSIPETGSTTPYVNTKKFTKLQGLAEKNADLITSSGNGKKDFRENYRLENGELVFFYTPHARGMTIPT
jgi:hypothetical protein